VPLVFDREGFELDFIEIGAVLKVGIGFAFRTELLEDGLAPGDLFSRGGDGLWFVGIVVGSVGGDLGDVGLELARQDLEFFFQKFKVRLVAHDDSRVVE
jgi:hypothetical protein